MFIPKKSKYKKYRKGIKFNKVQLTSNFLKYGQIGLIVKSCIRMNSKQLTMLYNNIKKKMKKKGRVFINVFPNMPVTRKPLEIRMGKGKGSVDHWVSNIRAGKVLCEVATPSLVLAEKVLKRVQVKLPVDTKVIKRVY